MKPLLVLLSFGIILSVHSEVCGINPAVVPQYKLSLCTMIHNEEWFIEEWIAYHLLLRVDHFYIYNDESTDIIALTLEPYIKRGIISFHTFCFWQGTEDPTGIVSLLPWNHFKETVDPILVEYEPVYTRPQRFAIADCLFHHQKESEYFGIWDMDEFAVLNDSFSDLQEFVSTQI
jgi:hypothetical protein